MRLDKRGIECAALVAFLGVVALGSANAQFTPEKSPDLSATVVEADATYSEGLMASLNIGTSLSFSSAKINNVISLDATTETTDPEIVADGTGIDWNTKCMANIKGSVNIRAEASTDSTIVGKLFEGGAADVIEKGAEWTRLKSGSVEGYIATEYLVFGQEAADMAKETGLFVSTILENTIRVREDASADSKVLGLVGRGERFETVDTTPNNGFIAISFKNKTGYVSVDYVSTELELGEAKSMEEIAAEEKAKKAAQQKAQVSQGAAVAAGADDVSLLAALIHCEAGNQSHAGKLAVGAVVVNRMKSGRYPNTVYDVIYQRGQFPPASVTGRVASVLASGKYSADCVAAAQEALSGVSNVGGAIGFAPAGSRDGIVIGPVVFF